MRVLEEIENDILGIMDGYYAGMEGEIVGKVEVALRRAAEQGFYAGMSHSDYAPESPSSAFMYWYDEYSKELEGD